MKRYLSRAATLLCFLPAALLFLRPSAGYAQETAALDGTWMMDRDNGNGTTTTIALVADHYFMLSIFDKSGKQFILSMGGHCDYEDGNLSGTLEFHTAHPEWVGQDFSYPARLQDGQLTLEGSGMASGSWKQVDNGKAPLAGNWHITQRKQDGKMNPIKEGPRKTLKLLTGTRFQWSAINTATGEFFGTGGGTYTFKNGKYTENIEFFSRDSSRVGMSLSFKDHISNGQWHHTGLSSKGDPIYEIWERAGDGNGK
ncbi:hypothetical protein [Compostibacter hankyongensis]|uniref:Membrane or secreted protein n=1 Tax=Compostibacter hankyongensis TaxID=1007089 RepID=A0ABP8G748_9BACT